MQFYWENVLAVLAQREEANEIGIQIEKAEE